MKLPRSPRLLAPVRGVLVASPAPRAIGKDRFTCGFLARLLVEKFVLGRPELACFTLSGQELRGLELRDLARRVHSIVIQRDVFAAF